MPRWLARASASAAKRLAAHSLSAISADTNAAPCASRSAWTGISEPARKAKAGCLPAVTVGRVVGAAQGDVVVGDEGRQRRGAVRFRRLRSGRLDAREQDLAAIGEMKAAAVDDIGNVAFALRWKCASLCARQSCRCDRRQDCAEHRSDAARRPKQGCRCR